MRHALIVCCVLLAGDHESAGIKLNLPDSLEWKDGPASLPQGAALGDFDQIKAILNEDPLRIREARPNGRRPLTTAVAPLI